MCSYSFWQNGTCVDYKCVSWYRCGPWHGSTHRVRSRFRIMVRPFPNCNFRTVPELFWCSATVFRNVVAKPYTGFHMTIDIALSIAVLPTSLRSWCFLYHAGHFPVHSQATQNNQPCNGLSFCNDNMPYQTSCSHLDSHHYFLSVVHHLVLQRVAVLRLMSFLLAVIAYDIHHCQSKFIIIK